MRVRVELPSAGLAPPAAPLSDAAGVVRLPLLQPKAGVQLLPRDHRLLPPERENRAPEKLLQVGELAKAAGKTVRAIHHYEELGLLKPDARSKGRFRLYDASAVTRVRWIGKLHDLGMSLLQIQQVVETWEGAPSPARAMADVRETYRAKLDETRAQIAHLNVLERELASAIDYLDTCDSCEEALGLLTAPEPALENAETCSACQLREREAEPDLVAGIVA